MKKGLRVWCVTCSGCGDVIYSRAVHDYLECSCGKSFVDGGGDYFRYGGDLNKIKTSEFELPTTRGVLVQDWATGADKYGFVTGVVPRVKYTKGQRARMEPKQAISPIKEYRKQEKNREATIRRRANHKGKQNGKRVSR